MLDCSTTGDSVVVHITSGTQPSQPCTCKEIDEALRICIDRQGYATLQNHQVVHSGRNWHARTGCAKHGDHAHHILVSSCSRLSALQRSDYTRVSGIRLARSSGLSRIRRFLQGTAIEQDNVEGSCNFPITAVSGKQTVLGSLHKMSSHAYDAFEGTHRPSESCISSCCTPLTVRSQSGTARSASVGSSIPPLLPLLTPPPSPPPSPPGSPLHDNASYAQHPASLDVASPMPGSAPADAEERQINLGPHEPEHDCLRPNFTWIRPGAAVEVALPDCGLQGSWYPATVVQLSRDQNNAVLSIGGLHDPDHPDGMLCEEHPLKLLRPPVPASPHDFRSQLQVGHLAELWWQQGWWHVIVKQVPIYGAGSAANCAERVASAVEWSLESVQYGHAHRLKDPVLRPCWTWTAADRNDLAGGWSMIEMLPAPLQPPKPIAVPPASASEKEKRGAKRKGETLRDTARSEAPREANEPFDKFQTGHLVEVRGVEEGFLGSWYAARVIETQETKSNVRLRLCYLAFQEEDGSFWEDWLDLQHIRPMPPDHDATFLESMKKGAPLEIRIEEGWWEVEFCGREGPNYVVAAKRYQVQHTVPASQLRPAWNWQQQQRKWSQLERKPPRAAKPEQFRASSKGSGRKSK